MKITKLLSFVFVTAAVMFSIASAAIDPEFAGLNLMQAKMLGSRYKQQFLGHPQGGLDQEFPALGLAQARAIGSHYKRQALLQHAIPADIIFDIPPVGAHGNGDHAAGA